MRFWTLVLFLSLTLLGCADIHPGAQRALDPICYEASPHFFYGFWHGLIFLFSFLGKYLFGMEIALFSPCGDGWYWFGFLFGIGSLGVSGGAKRSRRSRA